MFLSSYLLFPHLIIFAELGEFISISTPNLFHALDILFSSKTRTGYCLLLSPVMVNTIFLLILNSNIRNYRITVKRYLLAALTNIFFIWFFSLIQALFVTSNLFSGPFSVGINPEHSFFSH